MIAPEPRSYADFVAAVVNILEHREIPYAIAGSLASGLYGEPRTTLDVDLTVQLKISQVENLASDARELGLEVDDLAVHDRLRQTNPQSFNIIDPAAGWKADCYPLSGGEFERLAFSRRRQVDFRVSATGSVWVYSPEDVILYKLIYFKMSEGVSVKHLRDIAGMLVNVASIGIPLDEAYIDRWAERRDLADTWEELKRGRDRGPREE